MNLFGIFHIDITQMLKQDGGTIVNMGLIAIAAKTLVVDGGATLW